MEVITLNNHLDDYKYSGIYSGRYIEYDVIHILHDDEVDIHDTLKFRIKTVIGDTFTDNQGRISNKYLRYTWDDMVDNWKIKDVWSIILNGKNAELVDENQRLIYLTFPIQLDFYWNPSIYTVGSNENYFFNKIHTPTKLGNFQFDSTVTVIQNNYYTLVDYKKQHEIYAKNIGLISKFYKNLKIKNFDTLQVKKGEEWYFTLTNFGQE
jgi:hypothetical protein